MELGIDPGTKNIGIAVTDNGKLITSYVMDFEDVGGRHHAIDEVINTVGEWAPYHVNIERFVPYSGVYSKAAEEIILFIGGVDYALHQDCNVSLYRAIEWKPALCKYLVKTRGFSNPSKSFDKKFSMAAAESICGIKPKTDHEADAICLSHIRRITGE
jgi:hypothetical protein